MQAIIKKIMQHPTLQNKPPVLVDVGASGALPQQWKLLAPYSIGIAFDADTRDFSVNASASSGWNKLYLLNRIVAAQAEDAIDFYLTKSPHCSSALRPDFEALKPWAFSPLFEVDQVVRLPTVDLQGALATMGIDYIDWYKTDSQGADLRIFAALPNRILNAVIAAEFEPGIIDAYLGEDKLHALMAYMDQRPFWVSLMTIKGSQRIDRDDLDGLPPLQRHYPSAFLKSAPGWCEISYLNTLSSADMSCREYLLAWVCATLKGEHGFGLHVARKGATKFQDPLFGELHHISRKSLASVSGYLGLALKAYRKALRLLIRGV